jgi:hypothetical protein
LPTFLRYFSKQIMTFLSLNSSSFMTKCLFFYENFVIISYQKCCVLKAQSPGRMPDVPRTTVSNLQFRLLGRFAPIATDTGLCPVTHADLAPNFNVRLD